MLVRTFLQVKKELVLVDLNLMEVKLTETPI